MHFKGDIFSQNIHRAAFLLISCKELIARPVYDSYSCVVQEHFLCGLDIRKGCKELKFR